MANWQEFTTTFNKTIALNLELAICIQPGLANDTTEVVFAAKLDNANPGQSYVVRMSPAIVRRLAKTGQ